MPLEETDAVCGFKSSDITLSQMRDGFVGVLKRVVADPQMKRVFAIATHKVEYIDEMSRRTATAIWMCATPASADRRARAARRSHAARRTGAPHAGARRRFRSGCTRCSTGCCTNWMLDPGGFDLVRVGTQVARRLPRQA